MKVIVVVCVIACMQSAMTLHAQTVTLSVKNEPLENVFKEIKKQTGYGYFAAEELLKKSLPVTLVVKNEELIKVLDLCFANQPLSYKIVGSVITLKEKIPEIIPINFVTIKGHIINQEGTAIAGVSVRVKGTLNGSSSNASGYFILDKIEENAILEISHVSYLPESIRIDGDRELTITLKAQTQSLKEVVTTGYTVSTREQMVGSVSVLSFDKPIPPASNNILGQLAGKITGMMVIQTNGLPGSGFNIQIRGQRSVGQSAGKLPPNSPLFIVDGVPFLSSSESLVQLIGTGLPSNTPFSSINSQDIEKMVVLKDGNTTAMYGSLGANGVVLITTRKPTPGPTKVEVNMFMGEGRITRQAHYMNTQEYIAMRREALRNDGVEAQADDASAPGYSPDILLWDTTRSINWRKLLIGNAAHVANAHIRLSGGSQHTQFGLGIGYNRETTVFPGDFHKSLSSVLLSVNHSSPNNKFNMALVSGYAYDRNNLSTTDLTRYLSTAPDAPYPYDASGRLNFRENGIPYLNPLSYTLQTFDFMMERINASLNASYQLLPSLSIKTTAGYTIINGDETRKIPIASLDPVNAPTGLANFGASKNTLWIVEPQLEYTNTKEANNKHKIKATLGTSFREQVAKKNLVNGSGYISDASLGSIAGADSVNSTTDYRQYRLGSFYTVASYIYKSRYILNGSMRVDASSRFGPNKRSGKFGSIAGGWIFSGEQFSRRLFPFLSFGKLRASYGTNGNDQIGDYAYLDTWMNNSTSYQTPVLTPSRLFNSDLQWEQQRNIDLGLNLGFFHNRLTADITWARSRTGNQLVGYPLPTQTGFATLVRNIDALVQNRSIEMEVNATIVDSKDFKWSASGNVSFQKNKLLRFPGLDSSTYRYNYFIGQPVTLQLGYRSAGINPQTGIYQFTDHTGVTSSAPPDEVLDFLPMGTYTPKFFGGFGTTLQYHNWEFDCWFQFVNQKGKDNLYARSLAAGILFTNLPVNYRDRWMNENDATAYQKYTQDPNSDAYIAAYYHAASDAAFTDASYIRLKNVSLSYGLPSKWIRKIKGSSGCRVFVTAQNLLTITHYKVADPETGSINPDGLPPLRVITFGINASF